MKLPQDEESAAQTAVDELSDRIDRAGCDPAKEQFADLVCQALADERAEQENNLEEATNKVAKTQTAFNLAKDRTDRREADKLTTLPTSSSTMNGDAEGSSGDDADDGGGDLMLYIIIAAVVIIIIIVIAVVVISKSGKKVKAPDGKASQRIFQQQGGTVVSKRNSPKQHSWPTCRG